MNDEMITNNTLNYKRNELARLFNLVECETILTSFKIWNLPGIASKTTYISNTK